MDRLIELTELITQWGVDRSIVENSTPFAQSRKTHEEVCELVEAMTCRKFYGGGGFHRDGLDEVKDAIGDIYVTLVMVCACNDTPIRMDLDFTSVGGMDKGPLDYVCNQVPWLIRETIFEGDGVRVVSRCMVNALLKLCADMGLDFTECVEMAYQTIKDRRGTLMPDGVFVKEA
jgi:NTP pyrophosphatase (non-canonical NTP hydrolase)